MTDERREEIMEYGIDPDSDEGFRERLAYGGAPVLTEHPAHREIQSAKLKQADGTWIEL